MTAPSLISLKDQYGFVPDAVTPSKTEGDDMLQSQFGFIPDGSPMPKEEFETVLAEDKNVLLGIPKGSDLDEINLRALTTIYQRPKDNFFFGVPDKFADAGQGALADVIAKVQGFGGNLRTAADLMNQPIQADEWKSFFLPSSPYQREDMTLRFMGRGAQKIADFISGIDDWATDTYMGGERPQGSQDFSVSPARTLRKTSERMNDWAKDFIDRHRLKPDSAEDQVYNEERITPDQPVDQFTEDLAFGLGQGAMSALTSIGLAYATKRPELVAGLFGLQMQGQKYQEYIDRGMEPEKARRLSVMAGLGEAGLEYVGLEVFMNALRGSKVVARNALRIGSEALQEMLQQGSEIGVDYAAGIERDQEQALYEIGMAGLIGALVGAPAAVITSHFEENSYFGDVRKRYNLNDEQAGEVLKKRAEASMAEVKRHMAKKMNEELASAEIALAQEGPAPAKTEVSPEDQRLEMIAKLEDYRQLREELDVLEDQTDSPEQAQQYRQDLDQEIARIENLVGADPQEVRFSRRGQKTQVGPEMKSYANGLKGLIEAVYNDEEGEIDHSDTVDELDKIGQKMGFGLQWADGFESYEVVVSKDQPIETAQKNLVELAAAFGFDIQANPDGTVKLYHGTKKATANKMLSSGLNEDEGIFLSPTPEDGEYGGVNGAGYYGPSVLEFDVDPRRLAFRTEGELYAEEVVAIRKPKADTRFSRKGQSAPDLVVMHNLTQENIVHAEKMGGLAVPSLSIGSTKHPLEGFGDITLLADRELINPRQKSSKVFNADIYSPRYPTVQYKVSASAVNKAARELSQETKDTGYYHALDIDQIEREGMKYVLESPAVMLRYLRTHGQDVKPVLMTAETEILNANPKIKDLVSRYSTVSENVDSEAFMAEVKKAHEILVTKAAEALIENGSKPATARRDAKSIYDWYEKDGSLDTSVVRRIMNEVRDADDAGKVDKFKTQDAIKVEIQKDQAAYEVWAKHEYADIIEGERMPDGWRGERRKYLDHTLENVVRMMKRELQSGESFNYGIGNVRASVAKQYTSIKEIQADRSKIMSSEDFEKVKAVTDKEFEEILAEAYQVYEHKNGNTAFGTGDTFTNVLREGIKRRDVEGELKKFGFGGMDFQRINAFLETLRDMPTEYFEAKIQRAVGLNEFAGAVIPKNTSEEARQILTKNGIPFVEYDKKVPGSRTEAIGRFINEMSDIRFSRGEDGGSTVEAVQAQVQELSKGMSNLPEIRVVETAEDVFMQTGKRIPDDAEALWFEQTGRRDQIIMVASRLAPSRVAFVFYHELVGHYGLRTLYGPKFEKSMKDIYDRSPKIRENVKAILNKYAEYDQATATEEVLADLAAEAAKAKKEPSWWQTIVSRVRQIARNLGIELDLTDEDLTVILADARRMVQKKEPDTDLTAKQAMEAYNAAILDAEEAKKDLEELQPAVDYFKENKVRKTQGLEEDFLWNQIPRAFKARQEDFGQTLDHFVVKIGEEASNDNETGQGRDSRVPRFKDETEVARYMINLWQSYTYARARSLMPPVPRLRQATTITSTAWLKRREAVLRAREAGKKAGSDQVSYLMLKQDMRRSLSEDALKGRIDALKTKIKEIKTRTLAEREAAREAFYAKQADARRAILWKIRKKEAVQDSLIEFIQVNLPVTERGSLLKLVKAAGAPSQQEPNPNASLKASDRNGQIVLSVDNPAEFVANAERLAQKRRLPSQDEIDQRRIANAFERIQRAVDTYNRRQIIESIQKLAQKAQGQSVAVEYRQAVDRIIEDLDFQKPSAKTRARLAKLKDFITQKRLAGEDPGVGLDEYEAIRRLEKVQVSELNQVDLLNIRDRVAMLIQIGQTKRELLSNRWDKDKAYALQILAQESKNRGKLGSQPDMIRTKVGTKRITENTWQDLRSMMRHTDWSLLPMDAFIDLLDGYKDYRGANYRIFKNRIDLSFQRYLDLKDRLQKPLVDEGKRLKLTEEEYYEIGVYAAAQQEGGREKLLAYAKDEAEAAVINERIDKIVSSMNKRQLEWYDLSRKTLDELRPQIAEVMRRVYNQPLAEVKNYFPFIMDFDAMSEAEIQSRFGNSVEMFGKGPKGNVKKGFTIERTGGAFKIRLNALDVVVQHLDNATYLVEMGESIRFLQQIASSKEYEKIVGEDAQDFMVQWLSLLAKKGGMKRDRGLDLFRRVTGVYSLGFKLTTGLIQSTAIMDGASYIGPWVANGMAKIADDDWRKFMMANMPELRDRVGDDPAIAELQFVAAPQTWFDVVKVVQAKSSKVAYSHIKFMDALVAQAVTGGAYLKYLNDNKIELDLQNPNQDALNYAQMVLRRTQASAFVKDLPAAISRGSLTSDNVSWGKLLFQFQTYMLNRYSIYRNDIIAAGIQGKKQEAIMKLVPLIMAVFFELYLRRGVNLLQEELIEAIKELMGVPVMDDDEEEEDPILEEFFSGLIRNVPIVGQAYDSVRYGSFPIPAVDILTRPIETASAIMKSKRPEKQAQNAARLTAQVAGGLFGGGAQADQILRQVFK